MSLSLFIARRIYRESDGGKQVSRPAVLIAMAGIAIGLAVMIIAVAVVIGFKSEVRNKVIGFGSHIQITNLDAVNSYETHPIVADKFKNTLDFSRHKCIIIPITRKYITSGFCLGWLLIDYR